jgi:hypothetical protein
VHATVSIESEANPHGDGPLERSPVIADRGIMDLRNAAEEAARERTKLPPKAKVSPKPFLGALALRSIASKAT